MSWEGLLILRELRENKWSWGEESERNPESDELFATDYLQF